MTEPSLVDRITRDLLTFYRPNYIITGFTESTEVKLQFSAKFDLWPNATHHAVFFGFTEKALWNLYKPSAPFAESNYNPDLFYSFFHHAHRSERAPGCGFAQERVGLEHESNGEGGATSRAWNRAYVESRFACYADQGPYAQISLQIWAPPVGTSGNADIVKYLGYGELGLNVGTEGGRGWGDADLQLTVRKGTLDQFTAGSLELDGRWRPPYGGFWRFTPFLYAQLFAGDGETLLTYDRSVTAFRVGIGLSDSSPRTN